MRNATMFEMSGTYQQIPRIENGSLHIDLAMETRASVYCLRKKREKHDSLCVGPPYTVGCRHVMKKQMHHPD